MKKLTLLALAPIAMAGCAADEPDTYFCVNGPDLVAAYSETGVTLYFNDDTVQTLTRPDPARPSFYANAQGTTWAVGVNDARLDINRASYLCDKIS